MQLCKAYPENPCTLVLGDVISLATYLPGGLDKINRVCYDFHNSEVKKGDKGNENDNQKDSKTQCKYPQISSGTLF